MERYRFIPIMVAFAMLGDVAHAQSDWTTAGFDAQRSFWLRTDPKISIARMQKGGFEVVWKTDLTAGSGTKSFVTSPVLLDFYIGYRGFRSLGFTGTGTNSVVAMDTDLGRLEWKVDLKAPAGPAATAACPGGMTSGVARPSSLAYPIATAPRGAGRGTPAKSGVGEPFEGAIVLKQLANRQTAAASAKPTPTTRRAAAPFNPFAPRIQWVYALASDGRLHSLYVSNGEEPKDPVSFLPAKANAKGLIIADDVAYVATTNNCGGVDNGIWSLDIPSAKVNQWKAQGNIAGTTGVAFTPDGTMFAAAGNELAALEDRTLRVKSSYKIGKVEFNSSPVIFEFKGKDLIAATSNDGKLHLLDANAMENPITTVAAVPPGFQPGALATWQDASGTRWLLVPSTNAIAAWKVADKSGAPALERGWDSAEIISPVTPIIVNDVIFVVSSGEKAKQSVLYALDSANGRQLWNSGKSMTSYVTSAGLAAGGGLIYVGTRDGTQYVFGFPMEH